MNASVINLSRLQCLPIFWAVQTAIWSFAVLVGVFIAFHWGLDYREAFLISSVRAAVGFCTTSFLFRPLLRRLMSDSRNVFRLLVSIFFIAGIASILEGLSAHGLAELAGFAYAANKFLWMSILIRWPLYIAWSLLYWLFCEWQHARETALRLAQAEAERMRVELDLLRAQIDPHFLFNVLNTILDVADNPKTVTAMTSALSEHLAFSLHRDNEPHRLRAELAAVENYLGLEKYRFEENLVYRIDIPPLLLDMTVPLGTLLLPVENAVKYGRRTSPNPLQVEVSGAIDGETVVFEVVNSGSWISDDESSGLGIGLWNLKNTLRHFGGDRASFNAHSADGWVRVSIRLPHFRNTTPQPTAAHVSA